jgi:cobalamin biosynthesis Mg chelatase CobN
MVNSPSPNQDSQNSSPSVPLSVYRELAAELQNTRAMVESLKSENQQLSDRNQELVAHNQQLQTEIQKVVRSVTQLQEVTNSLQPSPTSGKNTNTNSNSGKFVLNADRDFDLAANSEYTSWEDSSQQNPWGESSTTPAKQYTSQQPEKPYANVPDSDKNPESGAWRLMVAIALIAAIAFGAGYLLVRPILNSNNSQ